jgi:hypothetical protein
MIHLWHGLAARLRAFQVSNERIHARLHLPNDDVDEKRG